MSRQVMLAWILVIARQFHMVQGGNTTCNKNDFTCKNNECILERWRCDGEADCKDRSDEQDCESYRRCSANQFQCKQSKICVNKNWRCDDDIDCADMSDELDCHHISCTEDQYRCTNGLCISKSYVCDGDDDCVDSSDEESCRTIHCKENEFRCHAGKCISKLWLCDGEDDCDNGEDERNCSVCLPRQWACQTGGCIQEIHRCDGDFDCDDQSDEIGCPTFSTVCQTRKEFRCESGSCIKEEWRCDGDKDCSDGTDEKGCGLQSCLNNQFMCTSGKCIPKGWLCDGQKDCKDHIDEKNCTFNKNSSCLRTQFSCINGQCIDKLLVCNRRKDCTDGSDETQCPLWNNQTSCGVNNGDCQHNCHDTGSSFYCSCDNGYLLHNLKHCKDVDECEIHGFCSQSCKNNDGNFTCSCREGYVLQSDRRRCKASGPKPFLLFSNQKEIRKIASESSVQLDSCVVDGLENAVAVDYDFREKLVFWTDTTLSTIKKGSIDGGNAQNVIRFGLESPCGLAIDWLGKKLFWADTSSGRIEVANYDGTQRKAIFWQPRGKIRAITLHPSKGFLFWTEWDTGKNYTKSSICRANMDGTDMNWILHLELAWPNGLTIDYSLDRMFWIDAKLGTIESSDLDGFHRRMVIRSDFLHPFAITVFEDSLYWTDTENKVISKANKFDGRDFSLVKGKLHSPNGITMYHSLRQPSGSYGCGENNGGCSHFCLPTSTNYSCACPTGYRLSNSTHCLMVIDKFIAFVGDFVVRQISLDTRDMVDVVLPFESVMDVFAMDWDPIEDEMYWADSEDDQITIRKGRMKSPHQEKVVFEFPGKLSGLGVDWLSRKLYWSDEERNQIKVSNLDGSFSTVVIWKKLEKPRNLILDVKNRYMYWSSHGETPSINRAGMDGYSQTTLISSGVINPTGLTLDKKSNSLYWTDEESEIKYFSLSTGKKNVIKVSHHSKTLAPFSIAVDGSDLYWTDSSLRKVMHAKKNSADDTKVIAKYKSNPVRIAMFRSLKAAEDHHCTKNNGGCSHLCLLSPTQVFRCACPAGRNLKKDKKTCKSEAEISRFLLVNSNERLHLVPLKVPYKTNFLLPSKANSGVLAFDIDVKSRVTYFIKQNSVKKEICYTSLINGGHNCILSSMLYTPGDIAVDPIRQYIFWTDLVTKKIYLADGEGRFWTVIIWTNLDIPSSIAVAYKHGYIFWSDLGKRASISRANMDGSSRVDIVTSAVKFPHSLTVDHGARQVYWTDFQQQRIEICDFNGRNRKIFLTALAGPNSIALFSRFVYWSEWYSNVIKRADKQRRSFSLNVIKGIKRPIAIKTVNFARIPVLKSPCERGNGGCSHFCLNNPSKITCACPAGLMLQKDGKSCETSPRTAIVFSTGKSISRISLDTSDFTELPLWFEHANNTVALAFDFVQERIYWTDANRIYSAFTNGSGATTILNPNSSSINGLAIDWIGRNLFWSNVDQKTIEVFQLNGPSSAVLVEGNIEHPSDLCVHPVKGYIFWIDFGAKSRIERSNMDGQSRHVVVSQKIHKPKGLTIDYDKELIYWADSFRNYIERCDFDGRNRFLVVKKSSHVFGLAVSGSHIYWTESRKRTIQRANRERGTDRITLHSRIFHPMSMIIVSRRKHNDRNGCSEKNGNCSGLCLATPTGRSCASVCDNQLYLKYSCDIRETRTRPTNKGVTTGCNRKNGDEECSTTLSTLAKTERRSMDLVYIVGAVVLTAFIIVISILIFICQKHLRRAVKNRNAQKSIVTFKKSRNQNMLQDGDVIPNDPFVSILPSGSINPEKSRTVTCRYESRRTLEISYHTEKTDLEGPSDEKKRLTVSDV